MMRLVAMMICVSPFLAQCSQKKEVVEVPAPVAETTEAPVVSPETPVVAVDPNAPVQPVIVYPEGTEEPEDDDGVIVVDEDEDEDGSNVVVVLPSQLPGPNGEAPKNPVSVKTKDDLPVCNRANEGLEVFVDKDEKVFKCQGGKFKQKKSESDDY